MHTQETIQIVQKVHTGKILHCGLNFPLFYDFFVLSHSDNVENVKAVSGRVTTLYWKSQAVQLNHIIGSCTNFCADGKAWSKCPMKTCVDFDN